MKKVGVALLACIALAVAMLLLRNGHSAGEGVPARLAQANPSRGERPARQTKPATYLAKSAGHGSERVSGVVEDEDDKRTPAEKTLVERIEKACDDEDFQAAVACVDEAQRCGVAEIRQSMVETLGWFGERALPELTPFIADADEGVRERAINEWTAAVSSISDERAKIGAVELAMGVLGDEDALESISNEYIGADEKLAVESLARIIAAGGSKAGVAKAKETYEFVTGDEWAGAEEAARWIAEEYRPQSDGRPDRVLPDVVGSF